MKRLILFFFIILIFISFIDGKCGEGEININYASFEELKAFTGIGDAKAQAIIDARPFDSLEEILEIYGIGEITLENMENENACVDDFQEEEEIEEEKEEVETEKKEDENEEKTISPTTEVIQLLPKNIKSEDDKKILDKTTYAKYGFVVFCILIGILFILKNRNKNELV